MQAGTSSGSVAASRVRLGALRREKLAGGNGPGLLSFSTMQPLEKMAAKIAAT